MQDGTTDEEMPVEGVEPLRPREARLERVSYCPASHPDAQPPTALRAGGGAEARTDRGWTPPEWERVFDAAIDAILLTDCQCRIAWANRATSQLLGKPLDEILGQTCSQAIHGTDPPLKVCPLAQAHHTKSHAQGEIHLRERGVWIEVSVDPVLDEKRDVAGVLHILRDVTERKRMKEATHEREEKYKNLFENAREAILLIDLRGNITAVNRLVEEYGFKKEKLIGKRLFDFIVENHRARARADFQVLRGGQPVKGEMEVITPKGVVSVEYKDNPIRRGGRIVGVQAILTDVTKRKRAEQLLREERDRVQKYLDIAGVMLVVIDTEERVGLINKKGCEILGRTEEDVLGKNWFDHFLPPRVRERTRAIFDGLMAGQADENEYAEEAVLTQDGRERIMGWHNTLLKDETGRIIATLSSGEDITDRRRAEEAYRSLVDHSLQGLVLFQEGKAVFANQAMAEITGYAIDEMLALSAEQVRDFVHPEDREIVWQNHRRRLAGEPVPEHYEMRGIRKDGLVCWLDIYATRIDYQGKPAVQATYINITERKRAEVLLRLSEEKHRGLFENAVLGMYQTTPDGEILAANPALVGMLGYDTFEQLAPRNLEKEGFDPEHPRSLFKDHIEADGRIVGLESAWKRRDGSTLWVRESARAVREETGKTLFYEGTVEDITERKRFEEALQQSESLYRSLFENMMNGLAYCRMLFDRGRPQDFIYLSVNEAFEAQTGLKNVVGRRVSEVIPGIRESDPELLEIYGRVALTGQPEAFETYVSALKMWLSISVYSPQKEYFVTVFDVITERKRAEEALRESEDKFKYVFDYSVVGKSITLLGGRMQVNNAFCQMLGYSPEEFASRTWQEVTHPDDIEATQRVLDSLLSGEKDAARFTKRYLHKNGSVVWADVSTSLRHDKEGKPLYFMTTVIDITEQKVREARETLMMRVLEALNRSGDSTALIAEILHLIKESTGLEAVGIRLQEGEDYPYYVTNGFAPGFVEAERHLCARDQTGEIVRDTAGNPVLECMCGNVICGRFDPSKPFFTKRGSFWTNGTTQLLASTTEQDRQSPTRNRCNREGYESVALIPLRAADEVIGLLQLNDHRPGAFTLEMIRFFEDLGASIGIALARQRAEEAVRVNQERLALAASGTRIGMYDRNTTTGETLWTEQLSQLLGLRPTTTTTTTTTTTLSQCYHYHDWAERVHPEDLPQVEAELHRCLAEREPYEAEYRVVWPDGTIHWVADRGVFQYDSHGQPTRMLGILMDITERMRAEQEVARLASFPQLNPNPVLEVDANATITFQNDAARTLLEQVRKDARVLLPPDLPEILRVFAQKRSRMVYREVQVDDLILGESIYHVPSLNVARIYTMDITERKHAEEALQVSLKKYRVLFESFPLGITVSDKSGKIIEANCQSEHLLGITREAHAQRKIDSKEWQIIRKDGTPMPVGEYASTRALRENRLIENVEMGLVKDKGEITWISVTAAPIPLEGYGVAIAYGDISERKRAEQQLLDYQNRLRELAARLTLAEEQERRRIAVGVHDQIGQRLALAKLALQSLNAATSDPSTHRPLEDVCKEIDQVLEDTHSLTFELSNPVLYEAGFVNAIESWLVQEIHNRHGLQHTFEADDLAATVDKDTGITLFQIVRELLANVVKHAKAKRVDVRIRKAGKSVQITVQDDGAGFEPSKVGLPDSKSGGYGLFSVRERLEYLDGNLKIESAPGQGTCISIAVPMQSRQKPRPKEASS